MMRTLLRSTFAVAAAALLFTAASADEIKPTQLVTNLENPCGVAVHPTNGHVFIATRYGVYRYDGKGKKIYIEVAGYPKDVYGKGPKYDIGPLGVAFLKDGRLVVGDGSRPDGEELVRIYKIDATPPTKYKKEAEADATLGPLKDEKLSPKGEGNFYGVAVVGDAIFVTCNGDDTKGWIAKSEIKDGKPGKLTMAISSKELTAKALGTGVDAPGAAVATADGQLLVSQKGEVNVAGDSLLTFYDPKTGELKKALKTGLNDIVGLAYSPKTKKLYAADFSWLDAAAKEDKDKKAGIYELTIKDDKVEAKLVTKLDKPTGIAFDKDGNLYYADFGTQTEDQKKKDESSGGLFMIAADQLK